VGCAEPYGSIDKYEGFHQLYFPVVRKNCWYVLWTLWARGSRYIVWSSFPFSPFCSLVMRSIVTILMWIRFFPIYANEDQVLRQIGRYIKFKNWTISHYAELFRIVAVQKTNRPTLLSLRRTCCWIVYALWLLLLCIISFTVRNLNNGNLGEKKSLWLLGSSDGVPCPLKITL